MGIALGKKDRNGNLADQCRSKSIFLPTYVQKRGRGDYMKLVVSNILDGPFSCYSSIPLGTISQIPLKAEGNTGRGILIKWVVVAPPKKWTDFE